MEDIQSPSIPLNPQLSPPELELRKKAMQKRYLAYLVILWAVALLVVALLLWTTPREVITTLANGTQITQQANSVIHNCTLGLKPC